MKNFFLLICCSLYFAFALLLFVQVPHQSMRLEIDSTAYLTKAHNYSCYHSFQSPDIKECHDWVAVGYSIFLVGIQKIGVATGMPIEKHYYDIVALFQILLGMLILLVTYQVSRWFFSQHVSCLAAFLASINLGLIMYPQFVLTDTLTCLLILAAFERFCAYLHTARLLALIYSGFLWGLSIWVKASAWYLVWVLALGLFLFQKERIRAITFFLLAFLIPVTAYGLYNKHAYGHFFVKAVDKVNLYTFYLPKLLVQTRGISLPEAHLLVESHLEVKEYASGKGWEKAEKILITEIFYHPVSAVKVALFNVFKTLAGLYTNHLKLLFTHQRKNEGTSFFHFQGSWLEKARGYLCDQASWWMVVLGIMEVCWQLIKYFLLALGFYWLLHERNWLASILFSLFIGYFIAITFPDGCARLRFLAEMPMLIVAAYGYTKIGRTYEKHAQ